MELAKTTARHGPRHRRHNDKQLRAKQRRPPGLAEINAISDAYHVTDFRVRFNFESDGGNNLYLDDVNINAACPLVSKRCSRTTVRLSVPNPVAGSAQVVLEITTSGKVHVELLDMLGRRIREVHTGDSAPGLRRLAHSLASCPADCLPDASVIVAAKSCDSLCNEVFDDRNRRASFGLQLGWEKTKDVP